MRLYETTPSLAGDVIWMMSYRGWRWDGCTFVVRQYVPVPAVSGQHYVRLPDGQVVCHHIA